MSGKKEQPKRHEPWLTIEAEIDESSCVDKTTDKDRLVPYLATIREALDQAMEMDPNIFVMGQGVDDPSGMFGTTKDLNIKYGSERCFDTPLAELSMMGVAVGAALGGMRPVYLHNRPDFLLLAADQLINHASKWSYMFGGKIGVPLTVWACIGRGWGSAAQHSQALQGLFMHVPGLKLVMPSTPYDAKGLTLAAIQDANPVLILEHRLNFKHKGHVPANMYTVPIGKGIVRRLGKDATVITISHMVHEALCAADKLAKQGIDIEVLDLRTLRPLDENLIIKSAAKTGRVVIADCGWKTNGITAEIAALLAEKAFSSLKESIKRVACPDVPTPAGYTLEDEFYVGESEIIDAVLTFKQQEHKF